MSKKYTVNQAIKDLTKLRDSGYGRAEISVDSQSVDDGNGSWTICPMQRFVAMNVSIADGDGFTSYTKAGVERRKDVVVLTNEDPAHYSPQRNSYV